MPAPVIMIVGVAAWAMVVWALLSGKVMAGSRSLKAHYYDREDEPLLYYGFLMVYFLIGAFLLYNARR